MKGKKILYVNQEVEPYIVGSRLAQQGGNLPRAALERGAEVRTFIPKYGIINERRNQLHDVHRLSGLNLMIAKEDYTLIIKVASIQGTRLQIWNFSPRVTGFYMMKPTRPIPTTIGAVSSLPKGCSKPLKSYVGCPTSSIAMGGFPHTFPLWYGSPISTTPCSRR